MNTRGLTELVILNVGRELGLIGDTLFTMMVVMALVTTLMTGPLLTRAYPKRRVDRDIAEAERAALGDTVTTRALVVARRPGRTARRWSRSRSVCWAPPGPRRSWSQPWSRRGRSSRWAAG